MLAQKYWNEIGVTKDFEDPIYVDKLARFLSPDSHIIEYGCGYGRMMKILKSKGYQNLVGFDFVQGMIVRGRDENPELDLRLLEKSGVVPRENESVYAVMMSTVLCRNVTTTKVLINVFSKHKLTFTKTAYTTFLPMIAILKILATAGLGIGACVLANTAYNKARSYW